MMENITEKEIFDRFTKVNFYVDGIVDMMYQGDPKDDKAKDAYKKQIKDTVYQDTAKKLIFDMYSDILGRVAGFTGIKIEELDIRKADNKFNSQEIIELDKTGKLKLDILKNKVENASHTEVIGQNPNNGAITKKTTFPVRARTSDGTQVTLEV